MSNPEEAEYESARLEELRKYNILDTLTEKDYDDISFMASVICDVPVALVTFIDEDRQWFKSHKGVDFSETSRELSFCNHALQSPREAMIVPDSRSDSRFQNNPFVTGDPHVRFYAGVPLVNSGGYGLGTVCVIDVKPRQLSADQVTALKALASQVMNLLEMRKSNGVLESIKSQLEIRNEELDKTAKSLQLALEAGKLGTWEIDLETGQAIFSEKFLAITGYDAASNVTLEQIRGQVHPDDAACSQQAFAEALSSGIYHHTVRFIWNDGSIHWIERRGKVLYDENNSPLKMIGTLSDITEERLQQQVLLESEEKFRLLADSMPQQIWTAGTEGNMNYYSKSMYEYSGISPEDMDENSLFGMIHPDEKEATVALWNEAVTQGKNFFTEHRLRRQDGTYRWYMSAAVPQKDAEDNIQMWVGTSTDIEDQKAFTSELEKQVNERTKELAQTNIDLDKMNKELQSFAYISSHDLQEPLRKIQTFSAHIMQSEFDQLSEKGKDYFGRMLNSAKRMQMLINDLLAYSRTATAERVFKKTDLNKIVEQVKDDLKEEIESKHAIIETSGLCEVDIIPFQFRQLLQNLFTNSLKFSRPGVTPQISISSETRDGTGLNNERLMAGINYCHISISDNGIGFEKAYREKIFELFQRLHGRSEYTGTGIGLAIVKKIVENHNGFISADGDAGNGATFDMYFPIEKPQE